LLSILPDGSSWPRERKKHQSKTHGADGNNCVVIPTGRPIRSTESALPVLTVHQPPPIFFTDLQYEVFTLLLMAGSHPPQSIQYDSFNKKSNGYLVQYDTLQAKSAVYPRIPNHFLVVR